MTAGRGTRPALCCMILTLMVAGVAPAEQQQDDDDAARPYRGFAQLGAFFAILDSGFRLGLDNIGLGIDLNVESFLGLDENSLAFRFDGGYRFTRNRRHEVEFSWFKLDRTGVNEITQDITLPDGSVILEGTTIESLFNFDIFKVRYDYSFLLDERVDLNFGAGLYVMPLEVGLGELGAETRTDESITAPLPVISLGFSFKLTPRWTLKHSMDFMYLKLSGVEGSIVDLNFGLERSLSRRIGLGIGFETLSVSVSSDDSDTYPGIDFIGEIGFDYTGIQLYVRGRL